MSLPRELNRAALDEAWWVAREALRPMPGEEILIHLKALFDLYGGVDFENEAAGTMFWRAWIEDLSEWPADLVEEACRRWRRSPAKVRPKSSGNLNDIIRSEFSNRFAFRRWVQQARDLRARMDAENPPDVSPEDRKKITANLRRLSQHIASGTPINPEDFKL